MSQSNLSTFEFTSEQTTTDPPAEPAQPETDSATPEPPFNATRSKPFEQPTSAYPTDLIQSLKSETRTQSFAATHEGVINIEFSTIAGKGGMGGSVNIENKSTVYDVIQDCLNMPAILSGGGMNSGIGSPFKIVQLTDVTSLDETVQVDVDVLWPDKSGRDSYSPMLGSYQLSLPQTRHDAQSLISVLLAYEKGKLDHLLAHNQQRAQRVTKAIESLESLSPGDVIDTPEYSTPLTVISEPWNTYAIIPRGTFDDSKISVTALTVDNPRGGYYQFAFGRSTGDKMPWCYLGHSNKQPPRPNTAFRRDTKFSATNIDIESGELPTDDSIIGPDETVLESPLPEPAIRTAIDTIDGIGSKTKRKLFGIDTKASSAEYIAHHLYNLDDSAISAEIHDILSSLPGSDDILDTLESYTPSIEN